MELVLGTDDQHVLAYKQIAQAPPPQSATPARGVRPPVSLDDREGMSASVEDSADPESLSELASASSSASVTTSSAQDANGDHARTLSATPVRWSQVPATQWRVQVFGAIYSLARVDVNRDGVDELLIASSTGVFVFEADRAAVLRKLEAFLVPTPSTSTSSPRTTEP